MRQTDAELRVQATEAYESIRSLDLHGDLIREILTEASLLADTYRCVRRHDIPHIAELTGLIDLLWQEVEMARSTSVAAPAVVLPQL